MSEPITVSTLIDVVAGLGSVIEAKDFVPKLQKAIGAISEVAEKSISRPNIKTSVDLGSRKITAKGLEKEIAKAYQQALLEGAAEGLSKAQKDAIHGVQDLLRHLQKTLGALWTTPIARNIPTLYKQIAEGEKQFSKQGEQTQKRLREYDALIVRQTKYREELAREASRLGKVRVKRVATTGIAGTPETETQVYTPTPLILPELGAAIKQQTELQRRFQKAVSAPAQKKEKAQQIREAAFKQMSEYAQKQLTISEKTPGLRVDFRAIEEDIKRQLKTVRARLETEELPKKEVTELFQQAQVLRAKGLEIAQRRRRFEGTTLGESLERKREKIEDVAILASKRSAILRGRPQEASPAAVVAALKTYDATVNRAAAYVRAAAGTLRADEAAEVLKTAIEKREEFKKWAATTIKAAESKYQKLRQAAETVAPGFEGAAPAEREAIIARHAAALRAAAARTTLAVGTPEFEALHKEEVALRAVVKGYKERHAELVKAAKPIAALPPGPDEVRLHLEAAQKQLQARLDTLREQARTLRRAVSSAEVREQTRALSSQFGEVRQEARRLIQGIEVLLRATRKLGQPDNGLGAMAEQVRQVHAEANDLSKAEERQAQVRARLLKKHDLTAEQIAIPREGRKTYAAVEALRVGKRFYEEVGPQGIPQLPAEHQQAVLNYLQFAQKRAKVEERRIGREYAGSERAGERAEALSSLGRKQHELAQSIGIVNSELKGNIGLWHQVTLGMRAFFRYAVLYGSGYALLGYFRNLTDEILKFDDGLKSIGAISQATANELKQIELAMKGLKSKFTTDEILEATQTLAQAGVEAKNIPVLLDSVSKFATATGTALQTAASVVTSVREVFGGPGGLNDASIANQLTAIVNISKLTGESLRTILSLLAQTGKGYGLALSDVGALAATLSNLGIKDSTVATGSRQALIEIMSPTDKVVKRLIPLYKKMFNRILTSQDVRDIFQRFINSPNGLMEALQEYRRLGIGGGGPNTNVFRGAMEKRAENVFFPLVENPEALAQNRAKILRANVAQEGAEQRMTSALSQITRFFTGIVSLSHTLAEDALPNVTRFFRYLADQTKGLERLVQKGQEISGKGAKESVFTGLGVTAAALKLLKGSLPARVVTSLLAGGAAGYGALKAQASGEELPEKVAETTGKLGELAVGVVGGGLIAKIGKWLLSTLPGLGSLKTAAKPVAPMAAAMGGAPAIGIAEAAGEGAAVAGAAALGGRLKGVLAIPKAILSGLAFLGRAAFWTPWGRLASLLVLAGAWVGKASGWFEEATGLFRSTGEEAKTRLQAMRGRYATEEKELEEAQTPFKEYQPEGAVAKAAKEFVGRAYRRPFRSEDDRRLLEEEARGYQANVLAELHKAAQEPPEGEQRSPLDQARLDVAAKLRAQGSPLLTGTIPKTQKELQDFADAYEEYIAEVGKRGEQFKGAASKLDIFRKQLINQESAADAIKLLSGEVGEFQLSVLESATAGAVDDLKTLRKTLQVALSTASNEGDRVRLTNAIGEVETAIKTATVNKADLQAREEETKRAKEKYRRQQEAEAEAEDTQHEAQRGAEVLGTVSRVAKSKAAIAKDEGKAGEAQFQLQRQAAADLAQAMLEYEANIKRASASTEGLTPELASLLKEEFEVKKQQIAAEYKRLTLEQGAAKLEAKAKDQLEQQQRHLSRLNERLQNAAARVQEAFGKRQEARAETADIKRSWEDLEKQLGNKRPRTQTEEIDLLFKEARKSFKAGAISDTEENLKNISSVLSDIAKTPETEEEQPQGSITKSGASRYAVEGKKLALEVAQHKETLAQENLSRAELHYNNLATQAEKAQEQIDKLQKSIEEASKVKVSYDENQAVSQALSLLKTMQLQLDENPLQVKVREFGPPPSSAPPSMPGGASEAVPATSVAPVITSGVPSAIPAETVPLQGIQAMPQVQPISATQPVMPRVPRVYANPEGTSFGQTQEMAGPESGIAKPGGRFSVLGNYATGVDLHYADAIAANTAALKENFVQPAVSQRLYERAPQEVTSAAITPIEAVDQGEGEGPSANLIINLGQHSLNARGPVKESMDFAKQIALEDRRRSYSQSNNAR